MKEKHIFATLGVVLSMGIGVVAANSVISMGQDMRPANAIDSGTDIYLDVSGGNWFSDGAKVAIWNHQGSCFEEFVSDAESGYYKTTLSTNCTSFNLFRGTALNWDNKWNQSDDATFETGKNLIKSTGYTDGKMTFTWNEFVPLPDPEYHLVGSFNSWTSSNDNLLTVDAGDNNHYTIAGVELEEEDELKIYDTARDIWYDNGSGNVIVEETGTYDIDFYVYADNGVHIVLNKEVVEPVYSVSCCGNAPITFVLDEDDKPDGVWHQYSAEVQYAARAGSLVFYEDGVEITDRIGVDYADGEPVPGNNVYGNTTDGFRIYSTYNYNTGYTKIYLKTYTDGGISLWGEGYSENEFSSYVKTSSGGNSVYLYLDEEFKDDGTYFKQYKTSSPVQIDALGGTNVDTSNNLICSNIPQGVNIEAGDDNNAKVAFQSSAWTVHNDCQEVIYLKMKKTDLSLWLYIGGRVHSYSMTVGGNEIALDNFKSDTGEYYASFTAVAGQTISAVSKDGVNQEFTVKQIGNNNLTSDKKIIVSGNQTAYFNINDNTLFIGGMEFGGYHIIKNSGGTNATFIQMTRGDDFEGFRQYYSAAVNFEINDTLRFIDTNNDNSLGVVFDIGIINAGGLGNKFVIADGVIKCVEACQTAVYMKLKSGVDEVYFGDVPEYLQQAIDFANAFVEDITEACDASESTRAATVKAAWDLKETAYNALSNEAKTALQEGNESSVLEIRAFAAKYEAIYTKRGVTYSLNNFMNWSGFASNHLNVLKSINSNALLIALIICMGTFVAAIGITLVVVKRKRLSK